MITRLPLRLVRRLYLLPVRHEVTCVMSIEKTTEEPKWVERRIAGAQLWWYRTSRDRLPCPSGVKCRKKDCKLLHPLCITNECKDKCCPYSHASRAQPVKKREPWEDIVIVGR